MPPSWSIANKSGIFPLLALFSQPPCIILRQSQSLLGLLTLQQRMTPPKKNIAYRSHLRYQHIDLGWDPVATSWLASCHLRKSGMIIWVTFVWVACFQSVFPIFRRCRLLSMLPALGRQQGQLQRVCCRRCFWPLSLRFSSGFWSWRSYRFIGSDAWAVCLLCCFNR